MQSMDELESAVVEMLLKGGHPALVALQEQARHATVRKREYSGVGFFTEFDIPPSIPAAPVVTPRATVADVEATIDGLRNGAGFTLFVRDGYLEMLEGYTYDEPWPTNTSRVALTYATPGTRALRKLLG